MLQQSDSIVSEPVVSAIIADTTVQQTDVSLPQYHYETCFAEDTVSYAELPGVAGDAVPYTMRGDDVIVCLLLLCFITTIGVFAHSRHSIFHQLKEFFYVSRVEHNDSSVPGTIPLVILNLQTSLLLGLTYYFYTIHYVGETYLLDTPYELIAAYFGVFAAYFFAKPFLYRVVNAVFFDGKKNRQWSWQLSFIAAIEGVAFVPVVIAQAYLGLSLQSAVYYFIFILVLAKLMVFYKCWVIFFRQNNFFLQIILYLCTLEIIPLLILGGVLATMTNELKLTF